MPLVRAQILVLGAPPPDLTPPPGVRFQHMNLGGTQTFRPQLLESKENIWRGGDKSWSCSIYFRTRQQLRHGSLIRFCRERSEWVWSVGTQALRENSWGAKEASAKGIVLWKEKEHFLDVSYTFRRILSLHKP